MAARNGRSEWPEITTGAALGGGGLALGTLASEKVSERSPLLGMVAGAGLMATPTALNPPRTIGVATATTGVGLLAGSLLRARAISGGGSAVGLGIGTQDLVECDTLDVEPAFDFEDVTISGCSVTPTSGTPNTEFTVEATITNQNSLTAGAEVGWFLSDLPSGPGVGRESVVVDATETVSASFTPNQVQEIVDVVGTDAEWTSVLRAAIIPGTVVPFGADGEAASAPGGFGLTNGHGGGDEMRMMTDGGCMTCGKSAAPAAATERRVDRRTVAVALVGIGSGVTAAIVR